MASPEHGPGGPDHAPPHEQPPLPYQRAARFARERPAGRAYTEAQQVIYQAPESDLSVYRFQLNQLWHVAALGLLPPASVLHAIERILDTGEPAELPTEIWQALHQRRAQVATRGVWTEGHYRPGKRL